MPHETLLIIPCLNEEDGIGRVLGALPDDLDLRVVVVDNGSSDASAERATAAGALVVHEAERGYGAACLRGIAEYAGERIVAFVDADYSDYPEELTDLLVPLREGRADLVIGSRMLRPESRRALLPQARYGNRLAAWILRFFYGQRATDLGPFRAITAPALAQLGMADRNFGWTVEMQAKAALTKLRTVEVPVSYRARVGVSKITGTLRGTLAASWKILWTLLCLRLRGRRALPAGEVSLAPRSELDVTKSR